MNRLINFLRGRELKREGNALSDFSSPKLARIGAFQGKLLLSTLKIQEHTFAKSLIFVASHNDTGAMGLIVNQGIELGHTHEIVEGLGIRYPRFSFKKPKIDVHYGGPVEDNRGFVLHSSDYKTPSTVAFPNGLAITSDKQVLVDAVRGKGPEHLMLAMGYAGWVRGQLEAEVEEGAWIAIPASVELVFGVPNLSKWQAAADSQGINPFRIMPDSSRRVS